MGEDQTPTQAEVNDTRLRDVKVIVAGSRSIRDQQFLFDALDRLRELFTSNGLRIAEIVSGDCRGPDKYGAAWAVERRIEVTTMPADWNTLGKSAGMVRNAEMADYADAAIIFWDGDSRGTANMISNMKKRDKPCHVIRP